MTLARCAIVSGGLSADVAAESLGAIADELRPLDPEQSLVLRAELLILANVVPSVRHVLARAAAALPRAGAGRPRLRGGGAPPRRVRAARSAVGRADDVVEEVEEGARGRAAAPRRPATRVLLALITLRFAERYELALRMLDTGPRRWPRAEGHAARQGVVYSLRAAISLEQGSLRDAQVDAETGLQLVAEPHFSVCQLLAVLIAVHVERGELDRAEELVRRGDASGISEDRMFLDEYLVARAQLRIAQGDAEQAVHDLLWCGERMNALGIEWQNPWRAVAAPALASLGESAAAQRLAEEQLALARRVGSPGALGLLAPRRGRSPTDGESTGARASRRPSRCSSRAPRRLDLAYALADLGEALGKVRRRREGRELSRRAMQLADECGATALAERARAELQSGPGRRARVELTGPGALTAAEWRVCRGGGRGAHQPRGRPGGLHHGEDRRAAPEQHLPEARHPLRHQLREAIGEQKRSGKRWGSPACGRRGLLEDCRPTTERIGPRDGRCGHGPSGLPQERRRGAGAAGARQRGHPGERRRGPRSPGERPNILFILVDEMRFPTAFPAGVRNRRSST